MRKRISKKKKKKINNVFKILGIISVFIVAIFCLFLYLLGVVPTKYILVLYSIIFVIYFIFMFLIFKFKIKMKIKVVVIVLLMLFNIIFCTGIIYISETINFFDVINSGLSQKEEYYVLTLKESENTNIKDLENLSIGVYKNINTETSIDKLKQKIKFKSKIYENVSELFDDIENEKIDAILINGSIKTLLETDLKEVNSEFKELYKYTISIKKIEDVAKVVDVTRTPFNIYIAGGDAYGDIGKVTNTDVNMIVTVDPLQRKILLTSIPRDYYVVLPTHGNNAYDKLTHAGYYGIEESIKSVEKLLDIDINYYVKVNFSTITKVIDAIGGVDVYSDYSFVTTDDVYYKFNKGMNHMNGAKALRFARERHSFKDGDVQRVKNQQKVLAAIIDKVSNSTTLISNYTEILDGVSKYFSTNMDSKSITRLVNMQLNNIKKLNTWSLESQNLVGTDFYTKNTYTFPGTNLYVMKRNEESVLENSKKIKDMLEK